KFQGGGPRSAANSLHTPAILPVCRQPDAGEIRHAIRRDIAFRVAQFVKQLLLHRIDRNPPAGRGVFRHTERSIWIGLHDWVTDVCHIGDIVPLHLALTPRTLRPASNNVSPDGAARESTEIE